MTASKHTKAASQNTTLLSGSNLVPAPDYVFSFFFSFFTAREQVSLYAHHQNVSKGRI
jgi:hypothetical protein